MKLVEHVQLDDVPALGVVREDDRLVGQLGGVFSADQGDSHCFVVNYTQI